MSEYVIERLHDGEYDGIVRFAKGIRRSVHITPDGDHVTASIFSSEADAQDYYDDLGCNDPSTDPTGITYRITPRRLA